MEICIFIYDIFNDIVLIYFIKNLDFIFIFYFL